MFTSLSIYLLTYLNPSLSISSYMVTREYLPLGYLLILAFLHVQILQRLQHFVCSVKMKVAFRCGFSTLLCHLHGYLQDFLSFIIWGSCSLKNSFISCSCVSQATWFFPTLWSSWHGCSNFFATRSPKHRTLVFQQCHLQVCLWRGEKQAMPLKDFATNGRHIVCQRPLPQVSSWISRISSCQKFQKHPAGAGMERVGVSDSLLGTYEPHWDLPVILSLAMMKNV